MHQPDFKKEFSVRLVKFSLGLIKFCSKIREIKEIRVIADQLLRSGTSIGANVTEAKAASSKKDYINFYHIALKSAHETQYWLVLIKESKNDLLQESQRLLDECVEISRILSSAIITMKKNK